MNRLSAFLVGGAVRDLTLHRPVRDRDWVVVGETPESMHRRGFKQVGNDFPVFLHPDTGEEYALARRERSTGQGHHDFATETQDVTLLEDLSRRDLTINAMALTPDGSLIDPHGGTRDAKRCTLRHIDPVAFAEDPLRVLRVARFAAQLPDFEAHPETVEVMRGMAAAGMLGQLSPERVFGEMNRAFAADHPRRFLEVLKECDALRHVLPEAHAIIGVPEHPEHHPEGNTWDHTLLVMDASWEPSTEPYSVMTWAALCHDLGKAQTPPDQLPMHPGHEQRSEEIARSLLTRLRAPSPLIGAVAAVAGQHMRAKRWHQMRPGRVLRMLEALGSLRDETRLNLLLALCAADDRGRGGASAAPAAPREIKISRRDAALRAAHQAAVAIQGRHVLEAHPEKKPGPWVGQVLTQMRVGAIKRAMAEYKEG